MSKDKRLINKKNFFTLFGILIIITFVGFIAAASPSVFFSPVAGGNYSTTLNLTINVSSNGAAENMTNISCFYNQSGGTAPSTAAYFLLNMSNSTANQPIFTNITFNLSALNDSATYNISCNIYSAIAGTEIFNSSISVANVTFDSTPPSVFSSNFTLPISNRSNYTRVIVLNISANDATSGIFNLSFNITNSSGTQVYLANASSPVANSWNATLNTNLLLDGFYNITVIATDFATNVNNTALRSNIIFQNTLPIGSMSCTPATVYTGQVVACSCSPTDNLSGINTSVTSFTANPPTGSSGTYSVTCSFINLAGDNGTTTTSYNVNVWPSYYSGSSSSSGTIVSNVPVTKSQSFTTITPSAPATITGFTADSGVSQIQITVNSAASNVQVQVDKYESLPTNVSTIKSGTYKYLHITTQNLSTQLSNAVMTIQVDKSWISQNNLTKDDIALFRYDENASQWNQLQTTFQNEDANYDYYNVNLTHFSYFAIASTKLPSTTGTTTTPPTGTQTTTGFLGLSYAVWIIIAAVILGILIALGIIILILLIIIIHRKRIKTKSVKLGTTPLKTRLMPFETIKVGGEKYLNIKPRSFENIENKKIVHSKTRASGKSILQQLKEFLIWLWSKNKKYPSNSVLGLINKKVYSDSGNYIGKVIDIIPGKNKIEGLKIRFTKKSDIKGVIIKYGNIKNIGEIIIIDEGIYKEISKKNNF